uniref:JNK1/MAPK8-associated membrane protein isoform X5 n=1 Tax=Petromyzon marinus TaxID=7757 RepID=A0AAJ7SQY6_PETMA|nr:JNK1/MAPK8-associated membrane protein isoform X5 [Petromyzon marinus]
MRSESHPVDMQQLCPGIYCGRRQLGGNDTYSECGACPRGERPDKDKFCQRCEESPNLYDWLYLGFMAMLPLILHWFFIEWYSRRKSPDYIHTIHCTQEAVFPLYTIVFIYYAFCLVLMMVVRPFLVKRLAGSLGKADRFQSIYAALYFLPILTLVQAVSAGLLYFAFPFILLVFSIVTCAVYFALMKIVNIQTLFSNKRNLIVLLSHWVVHTYGIISITRLESLKSDLPMLALVPGPALFYLLTAKFTDPERIHSELNAG